VNCSFSPFAFDPTPEERLSDTNSAAPTVSLAEPEIFPKVAVTSVLPIFCPEAIPFESVALLILAIEVVDVFPVRAVDRGDRIEEGAEIPHVTELVISRVELSE